MAGAETPAASPEGSGTGGVLGIAGMESLSAITPETISDAYGMFRAAAFADKMSGELSALPETMFERTEKFAQGIQDGLDTLGATLIPAANAAQTPNARGVYQEADGTIVVTGRRLGSSQNGSVVRQIGNIITAGEGNYESYNTGTRGVKNDKVGYSFIHPAPGTVTGKTINQILSTERLSGYDKRRMFATGKFQTTFGTLSDAKTALKLTGNELYTADLQERVFSDFLIYKAGNGKLADFLFNGQGTVTSAQYAASKEWASIGVPAGLKNKYGITSNGYVSYYQKPGQNAASISSTNTLRAALTNISSKRR